MAFIQTYSFILTGDCRKQRVFVCAPACMCVHVCICKCVSFVLVQYVGPRCVFLQMATCVHRPVCNVYELVCVSECVCARARYACLLVCYSLCALPCTVSLSSALQGQRKARDRIRTTVDSSTVQAVESMNRLYRDTSPEAAKRVKSATICFVL